MHDFEQTMKDWRRMCKSRSCDGCDLYRSCHKAPECRTDDDILEIVTEVREWAAAHHEPQYPTWTEWLLKVGAVRRVPIGEPGYVELPDGSMLEPQYEIVVKRNERIPADIARMLGIEPKEAK